MKKKTTIITIIILILAIILFILFKPQTSKEFQSYNLCDLEKLKQSYPELKITKVGSYTGKYVEDGKDKKVKNVFSMMIENTSDQMVQVVQYKWKINKKEALFRISNLAPHKKALALDLNKNKVTKKSKISLKQDVAAYFDSYSLYEDEISIEGKKGKMTVSNITNKQTSPMYIYYKNKLDEDTYLGGITYRVLVTNIPKQTAVDVETSHYKSTSQITNIQRLEE